MTIRSVIVGLMSGLFIAGFGFINDWVLRLESFNNGHLLPIFVIGTMFLFIAAGNPLLHKIKGSLAFKPEELAVVVGLMMVACSIPGRGMFEQFTQIVIMPYHWYKLEPGWRKNQLMNYLPKDAYVDVWREIDDPKAIKAADDTLDRGDVRNYEETVGGKYEVVVTRYQMGTSKKKDAAGNVIEDTSPIKTFFSSVPWEHWKGPLTTWIPLILLMAMATVTMSIVVHRQWAHHELLSYPIAEFTSAMLEREEGKLWGKLFIQRLFWIGFGIVFLIRTLNGLKQWFPDNLVSIPLDWHVPEIKNIFPILQKTPPYNGRRLCMISIFPLVIAFSFLLRSEISLTLGISHVLWYIFAAPLVVYGVNLTTDYEIGGWMGWHRAGAYSALSFMIIYFGRNYYKKLVAASFGIKSKIDGVERSNEDKDDEKTAEPIQGVWAFRIFVLSTIGMITIVVKMGLSWPIAILTVLLILQTYMIVARIGAETGLFFIQPGWQPFGVLMPFFGTYAMGPGGIMISALVCCVLCVDQSQALMPYLVNGMKIAEKFKVKVTNFNRLSLITYSLGIGVALVVVLGTTYKIGIHQHSYSYKRIPTIPFRAATNEVLRLQSQDNLEASQKLTGIQRIMNIRPSKAFLGAFGSGFVLVLIVAFLRLRFSKFPSHPLLFLVWGSYPLAVMYQSFFFGWLAKIGVQKYGGNTMVQKLKPLAYGIVAGEIMGALVFMIGGGIYYFVTGEQPQPYSFFPR